MNERDDETLLRRYARESDEAAFRELARRHGPLVYAACLRDVRRPDLAEDAAQAVFLDLACKARRVRVKTSLVPWLYAASRFASRNVMRAERRRPTVPLDESVLAPEIASDDALFQALDALNGPEHEAVVLRFVQGLSLAEVGRAQGVSEDAARMRVNRALKRLRTEYVPALTAPLSLNARLATLALPKPLPPMTTPLLLSTGGLAALATVGIASWRATPVSSPASPALVPAISPRTTSAPTVTVDAKLGLAQKAGAFPALTRPFTLVYHCTERDLRSQEALDGEAEKYRRDAQREVDADRMAPEQMRENVASMRTRHAPWVRDVTLSYDGRTLYVESRGETFLVGDSQTFQFPPASDRRGPSAWDGYALWVTMVPTVGASLPHVPFVRGGETLVATGAPHRDGKPIYNPGKVRIEGDRVVAILNKFPDERLPYGTTTLSAYRRVAGVEVAGLAVYREQTQSARPTKTVAFQLISASDRPLPADRFDPERYLPERSD